jgi:hypothetical protein
LPHSETAASDSLPSALWIWNNDARRSLPPGLLAWLGFLVLTCLASAFFVVNHFAARWLLGGFIASHAIVFRLPSLRVTVRRGLVSLLHVLCWSPGWVLVIFDTDGRGDDMLYRIWSYTLIAVVSFSFIFDLRDTAIYVYYHATGKIKQ